MPQKVSQSASLAKITRQRPEQVLARTRLLQRLDRAGKTTLVADHIGRRKRAGLWYQIDDGDADIAAFFHYLGLAVNKAPVNSGSAGRTNVRRHMMFCGDQTREEEVTHRVEADCYGIWPWCARLHPSVVSGEFFSRPRIHNIIEAANRSGRLPLAEFPHGHPGGFGPVDVALGIRDHAFAHALGLGFRTQAWNESSDRAVPHAADPDAPLEARVELRVRLVIGHI